MKKNIIVIIINIIVFCFLLFMLEAGIWYHENQKLLKENDAFRKTQMYLFHPGITYFEMNPDIYFHEIFPFGRKPAGLEFNGKPVIFFGCSFTYGFGLREEQTLPYKFAYYTKRPTYNRAYPAWGIQQMLFQARMPRTYEQLPEPEYVIFTDINDHTRRLYLITFRAAMLHEDFNLRYKEVNGELKEIRDENIFAKTIKRLYISNIIYNFWLENIFLRPSNYKTYRDFELKHFIESKKEFQKHWPDAKYVIIFYERMRNDVELKKKLAEAGYIIINAYDLTDKDLREDSTYMQDNFHPTEEAWNLLTPLIAEKLGL